MTDRPDELTIENLGVPIDRTTTAAWSDPNLRAAVEATGRTKLVMAGLVPALAWATEPARRAA